MTNQPIVIGRRFFSMCSLFFILFSSLVFLPLFRSEYLGSCILFGLMRSAIICTQTVGHSPLKKISHDIFRTRLVCLTFVAERAFIGMLLPITTCAQGVLDIVFLGVKCDDICLISPSCSFYCQFLQYSCGFYRYNFYFFRICSVSAALLGALTSKSFDRSRLAFFFEAEIYHSFFEPGALSLGAQDIDIARLVISHEILLLCQTRGSYLRLTVDAITHPCKRVLIVCVSKSPMVLTLRFN